MGQPVTHPIWVPRGPEAEMAKEWRPPIGVGAAIWEGETKSLHGKGTREWSRGGVGREVGGVGEPQPGWTGPGE